jgi:Asp-tRNA(Asn)/Glu-tRNA(Gln) amidotransferase B subunit
MARRLARAPWAGLFDEVAPEPGEVARRLAGVLEKRIPYHARRRGRPRRPDWGEAAAELLPEVNRVAPLVRAAEKGKLRPEALTWALDDALEDPGRAPGEILKAYRPLQTDGPAVRKVVREVVGNAQSMPGRSPDALVRWAMGEVMRELFGRVDPRGIREQLGLALGRAGEDAS